MPSILLVRHGQASFGGDDYDLLSARGEAQALATAEELTARSPGPARVVSGALRRQRDTAAPAAAALGLKVEIDPRWDEYEMDAILAAHTTSPIRTTSHGTSGQAAISSRDFQDLLDEALTRWIEAGADGSAAETWPGFTGRTSAALSELAGSLSSGQTALVFTSGGVLGTICAELLGLGAGGFMALNRVTVNAGLTRIAVGRRGSTLISFNEHSHLERRDPALVTYR